MRGLVALFLLLLSIGAAAQDGSFSSASRARAVHDSLMNAMSLDSRDLVVELEFRSVSESQDAPLILGGCLSQREYHSRLLSALQTAGLTVLDSVRMLPDRSVLGDRTFGVVTVSVANLRSEPDFSSEMVTQALLGTPVKVLDQKGWLLVETPDGYHGWVHASQVRQMDRQEAEAWNLSEQVVVTSRTGYLQASASGGSLPVSDLVAGCRMRLERKMGKGFEVSLPDGRRGFVSKADARELEDWRRHLKSNPSSIVRTARTLMGFPYLWAGMSTKGMDCSGFVRTVLFMHDIIIPRDASQMALKGERLEVTGHGADLLEGDLIFFGRRGQDGRERVSHVAISQGHGRFIHSLGYVMEASLDPSDALYDRYNASRVLFAVRFLPYVNVEKGLETTWHHAFYSGDL